MKKTILTSFALMVATSVAAHDEKVFSTRTIDETVTLESGQCRLIVDNVFGDLEIAGHEGSSVEIEAVETIRAESAEKAERAAVEVVLDIDARGSEVELFVDGPFRDRFDRRSWSRRHRDPGYTVVYDIEVKVPKRCDLDVRTVTDGEVSVHDVAGELVVHNVNGGILLERVSGTGGEVRTVNGSIVADFPRSPVQDLSFATINGRIEVAFPHDLAADLRLESRWGEMWSEFDARPLPMPAPEQRREDGRLVIEMGSGASLRVGSGGPLLEFETLNGDILIRKEG